MPQSHADHRKGRLQTDRHERETDSASIGCYYSQHITSQTKEVLFGLCAASIVDIPFVAIVIHVFLDGTFLWPAQLASLFLHLLPFYYRRKLLERQMGAPHCVSNSEIVIKGPRGKVLSIETDAISEILRFGVSDKPGYSGTKATHTDMTFLDQANQLILYTDQNGDDRSVEFFSDVPLAKRQQPNIGLALRRRLTSEISGA